jgi:cation diffusion facilitator CzcD-associated flavoprotein CzcO
VNRIIPIQYAHLLDTRDEPAYDGVQGCASDVPIHFYSLSTDLNPYWDKLLGSRYEIHTYWKRLTQKYNISPCISYHSKVVSARWDTERQLYTIEVQDVRSGEITSTEAQILISAIGVLEQPRTPPDLKGVETFKGDLFHSARWRHDVDLRGKRVGVIGNGCSA